MIFKMSFNFIPTIYKAMKKVIIKESIINLTNNICLNICIDQCFLSGSTPFRKMHCMACRSQIHKWIHFSKTLFLWELLLWRKYLIIRLQCLQFGQTLLASFSFLKCLTFQRIFLTFWFIFIFVIQCSYQLA